ncbi:hypothetical protein LUX33_15425 [Actinomadura madurae]|uniref:hypothetical protein n=1 Tax=Actinomadura madurae TaxID=1993 RepID=UPI0020D24BAC|nr:hypothetical protein [Actinomadura madurae]MCP9949649.1 hypothetical protein [Actinomadura madurae]
MRVDGGGPATSGGVNALVSVSSWRAGSGRYGAAGGGATRARTGGGAASGAGRAGRPPDRGCPTRASSRSDAVGRPAGSVASAHRTAGTSASGSPDRSGSPAAVRSVAGSPPIGMRPVPAWAMRQPQAKTSAAGVAGPPTSTSGAIQPGVPRSWPLAAGGPGSPGCARCRSRSRGSPTG